MWRLVASGIVKHLGVGVDVSLHLGLRKLVILQDHGIKFDLVRIPLRVILDIF